MKNATPLSTTFRPFLALALAAASILSATGCGTTGKREFPDEIAASAPGEDIQLIAIAGTNDIHGAIAPQEFKSREAPGVEPVTYRRGGLSVLAAHLSVLRKEFGPRLLVVDGGDEFQGSIESNRAEGAPMVQFFNAVNLDAAAIGNHEFDFGPVGPEGATGDRLGALRERLKEAKYPYLSANMVEKKTGKLPAMQNLFKSTMRKAGDLDIGIIGLTTLSTPVTTRPENVADLEFTDLQAATLAEARRLREAGAEIVIVVAHVGVQCLSGNGSRGVAFRRESDPQGPCIEDDEAMPLLRGLPAGTIDAFIAGHSHQIVHHWVNGVPVIQAGTRNQVFNVIYLAYDRKSGKLLRDRTRIEGPIPVCPEVFENQRDCNGDVPAPSEGRGDLVTPVFHGSRIRPDSAIEAMFEPMFEATAREKARILATASKPIEHTRTGESPMGNLIADALRKSAGTDVALVNPGGIRASFEAGAITFEDLFRVLPFDNSIAQLTLTGKELRQLLRIANSGARGIFPTSGLRYSMIELGSPAPSEDLDRDGKISPWEVTRVLDVRLSDGRPLRDTAYYSVATIDFLVSGGDDLGWFMRRIPKDRVKPVAGPLIRDIVERELLALKTINSDAAPLVRKDEPRVRQVDPPARTGGSRRRR